MSFNFHTREFCRFFLRTFLVQQAIQFVCVDVIRYLYDFVSHFIP